MLKFIAKHEDQISGVLSGFDRLVFRGTLRSIAHAAGMQHYLSSNDILLKHFGAHVEQVSQRLKAASLAEAVATGRPVRYLAIALKTRTCRHANANGSSNGSSQPSTRNVSWSRLAPSSTTSGPVDTD